ncbi:DEAD/DEAH box helicase [Duganella sp.]|uniref:DEAD/DEAH box helicase n=1 Tax=Duganella sp. TaxID=1904440 RepID=UPI0031DE4A9D
MHYSPDDVRRCFDQATYQRGATYFRGDMVLAVALEGGALKGKVSGSAKSPYKQSISLAASKGELRFEGDCTCPMEYNCKHVVAVLLAACESGLVGGNEASAAELPYDMAKWLASLAYQADAARREQNAPKPAPKQEHRLIYVLMPQPGTGQWRLHLGKGRVAADGLIRSATLIKDIYAFQYNPPAFVRDDDRTMSTLFIGLQKSTWGAAGLEMVGLGVVNLLVLAGEAGVLYSAADSSALRSGLQLLQVGPERSGSLAWRTEAERLSLGWAFDDGAEIKAVLATVPPYYLADKRLGRLHLPDSLAVLPLRDWLALVARAPQLAPAHAAALGEELFSTGLNDVLPLPQMARRIVTGVRPTPVLALYSDAGDMGMADFGLLTFDYNGQRVGADPRHELQRISSDGLETIERHAQDEALAWSLLQAAGFEAAGPRLAAPGPHGKLHLASERDWLHFAEHGLPSLRAQGWQVELAPGFRFDLASVEEWYAHVNDNGEGDGAGNAWLELELGIVVNGVSVPLLPVLLQLIRQAPRDFAPAALEARGDDDMLLTALPDGARVALPWGRVKPILRTLGELYFTERIGDALRLAQLDVARLAELESYAQLRWMGGERLRALGRKLAAFEQVQVVPSPAGLQASLRPYQAEGLAWMQFLREYGLAGILADDMGLGKTIQTLSHILTEKEAGRLTAPALVVAPTSLMDNWQSEAARFTPGLRVLLLTGPDRQQRFGEIGQADLVLTTYALLPRDEDVLRQQQFHLLILDESQYIKNHRSKAAQTAGLIPARHCLCLTGTPMQNHLGELWSQFNFLMPGLLGDEKQFNADFRRPIEKQGDGERNAFLIRRIKPFLLRRTKDSVAKELPPKTEMVRMIDLAGGQRDLYETVRLAMDKKVRDEIARKGVARSQIVILDALLKLRQVCCDPRLLKSAGARKAGTASAKLEVLMELVEELLSEGRKLLVFSQFTSMLALIETELQLRAVPYALLTGETVDRAAQVNAFQGGQVPVFLISLKAGGVGLNLTAADTVIHYDPWWNPAAENQATDRAWRIGQDKPVFVYRLIARGTLEEKIQELQRTKAGLADAVLAGGETEGLQITPEELLGVLSATIS